MEVYGCGYQDDVDYLKYSKRSSQTHSQAMIIELERLVQLYNLLLISLDKMKRDSALGSLPTY